jgi:phenylacetate-coenzyme A ligase PaaK-like adenylate-forming protein
MQKIDALVDAVTLFLKQEPFSISSCEKDGEFLNLVNSLTEHHLAKCDLYRNIVKPLFGAVEKPKSLNDIPFIPVRLFKSLELRSVENSEVFRTMTSSGTTGDSVSRISLDKETSQVQTRALSQIISSVIGKTRMPMLILDSTAVIKDRAMFSARGAGIRGFSMFGKDIEYALDESMNLRIQEIKDFLNRHDGERILLFGFTFMIWQHVCEELRIASLSFPIHNGILFHGGGWKKLASKNIKNESFKALIKSTLGIETVINYYGMVEQTGSIFIECEYGYLHSPSYSEVIIRNPISLLPAEVGHEGVVQVISILPMSYPGHSILTEDLGTVIGRDNCQCGRIGQYFVINGRIKDAEVRGCSDTYGT